MGKFAESLDADRGRDIVNKMAAELIRRGIDVEDLGRLSRVSMWQGLTKNDEGEAELHDLYGFQLSPSWDTGPAWPMVSQGPPCRVARPKWKPHTPDGQQVTVVWPDMQIGFYRHPNGQLEPTHDEYAIGLALAITRDLKPDRVVLLGDNLDLPEMSRFRLTAPFQGTMQPAINYATALMGRIRSVIPAECSIDWLAGNHEERLQYWLTDNARAAFGLRQGQTTDGWPVLSVPHLCRLDEHEVTYHPGYPANDLWITERLRIIHGDRVKSNGSTAHKYLDREKSSVIYGHIHRIERAHKTRVDHDGPREIMAASPGCLARIDGVVPSTKQGLDLDGRPLTSTEDWQQGIAVVHADMVTGEFDYEQVRIDPTTHTAWFRGRKYDESLGVVQ